MPQIQIVFEIPAAEPILKNVLTFFITIFGTEYDIL